MADTQAPNENYIELPAETTSAPTTTATKMVVSGAYAPWGFEGSIEFEYSLIAPGSPTILIRTLNYYLKASYQPASSTFNITAPNLSPLSVNPTAINRWVLWGSSSQTTSRSYNFDFIFQAIQNGPSATVRKTINLPI
ncbi:hypothetical protein [Pseudomonas synxantha]|uniref:hypothetical protein n=1 Tax=Pseudomonas synxantha TaxID=47883 RepID=UPI000F56FEDE|nr:hypothetical protein [Pseudomonas synxantha]